MLGTVKHITPDLNNQLWNINMSGFAFEDYIISVIEHSLKEYYAKGVTVEQTPKTRDHGKDLIIRSPIAFSLFGKWFDLSGKGSICIYVELKSSKSKVGLDRFSKNILLANQSVIDYFVLVTNTTIVPFSYYEASRNAQENGYGFYLVDQYLLTCFLKEQNALYGNYEELKEISSLSIEYQIDYGKRKGRPYLELYLLFRNNTQQTQICTLQLKSDRNWMLSETQFDVFLEAGESHCRYIGIKKEHFDGIDEIVIAYIHNNETKNIIINGDTVDYEFETPLVGESHKALIGKIVSTVQENTGVRLINLRGEAGIGKTRILDEAIKKLSLNGIELFHYICAGNRINSEIESLMNYLRDKLPQFHLSKLTDITGIPMHFKRYAIVIEDIHNADKYLFAALKAFATANYADTPFTIITAGRDDYTVYNESYFSFLSWLKSEAWNSVDVHTVEKLTDDECCNMIRAIIMGAPEFVIEKIHNASENNPFYVSQYIEYLLETKLIYLLNRNTVGITNVASFSQKLYIPASIEALLNERYTNIAKFSGGKHLQMFLLLLSFYGIETPQSIYHRFFSDATYTDVEVLYKSHFLKFTYENKITFDHENIFLFLRSKLQATTILELASLLILQPALMALYPDMQQATVFFYTGDLTACEALLQPAIDEIRKINNISSCNLTPHYLEVYQIIYNLACKRSDTNLQRKTLLAWMYVALHNLSVARGGLVINDVIHLINHDHPEDVSLGLTARQMQAHLFLQSDRISQAKKLLLELVAQERKDSKLFDDETRFDLFDRISSVYTQENHKEIAQLYNQLSHEVAIKLEDDKLLTLSKIIAAKIEFYSNTREAQKLMYEAKALLNRDMSPRINCHNDLGILTANLVLEYGNANRLKELRQESHLLLRRATEVEYPGAIIRGHQLLSTIYYLSDDCNDGLVQAQLHLEAGISDSIRNGISKFMPQFYCLLAMIAIREGASIKTIYQYFQTMLQHMRQCDQFFLGALDFTYHNVILLTNYVIFLCEYGLESQVYQFLSEIKYYGSNVLCDFKCSQDRSCYYSCQKNMDVFKKNYQAVNKGGLLFVNQNYRYSLRDWHTPFYIPVGV